MKLAKLVLALYASMIAAAGAAPADLQVTTLAGTGAAGIADGPESKATFLFPAGVAVASDGSTYISDSAAQRIRVLSRSGTVSTVAGSGPIVAPGFAVAGGYRDGPARSARFNGPEGIAIGAGGALYIADSYNGCIRRLWKQQVTTAVGKCGDPRAVDGPRGVARLNCPRGVAFDGEGNLYIADDHAGLRRFGKDGTLTTIAFKSYFGNSARGVSITGGSNPEVLDSTIDGVVVYYPLTGRDENLGALRFSVPNQIAAIDPRQFLFTDLATHNIRYFRLPEPPFASQFIRVIAGRASERGIDNAGFANGSRADARFYDPMGIAITGNTAIVADGGNRRVRRIALPRFRVTETGLDPANQSDGKHYEVALVGASWSFWDTFGDDSICAQIERTLDRSHRFGKPVRCHTVTIDGAKTEAMEDYIKNVFPYQHVDLVILDAESWSYNLPDAKMPGNMTFAQLFRSRMQGLLNLLTPLGTKLALVWIYPTQVTSDAEWIIDRPSGAFRALPFDRYHEISVKMESALAGMPILQYDMYKDMIKYELSFGSLPLYHSDDQHPNPRGNAFFGEHFAQGLLDEGLGKK